MTQSDPTPLTEAGRFLAAGLEAMGFAEDDANERIIAIEVEAADLFEQQAAALPTTPTPSLDVERAALDQLRALRITGDDIDAAIESLGPTGDRAEAYVKVAAGATAAALRMLALSSEPSSGPWATDLTVPEKERLAHALAVADFRNWQPYEVADKIAGTVRAIAAARLPSSSVPVETEG